MLTGPDKAPLGPPAATVGKTARWVLPTITGMAAMAILGLLVLRSPRFLTDGDTGWHIRTGEVILQTATVPRQDLFSYSMPARPWFAWEWLTDVLMSVVHSRFGLPGLTRATLVVLFLSYVLLLRVTVARGADVILASVLVVFGAVISMMHWLARPHVLSILLLLVWLMSVETWRRFRFTPDIRAKAIYVLPLLTMLWANLHGAFVVTFPMLFIYAAGDWFERAAIGEIDGRKRRAMMKTYAAAGAAVVACSLATPYGVHLYRHLWQYLTDSRLLESIEEFQSPNFHNGVGKAIEVLLFCAAVACARALWRRRFIEAGLLLLWSHMSLQSLRHVPLAVIVLTPIIAEHWTALLRDAATALDSNLLIHFIRNRYRGITGIDRQLNGGLVYAGIAVYMIVLVTGSSRELNQSMGGRFDESRFPVGAADFMEKSWPAGHGYAPDQFGGYLIYRFYPKMKVFIDGRSDFYNTGPVIDDYLRITNLKPDWAMLLDKYDIKWLLVRQEAPLASAAKATGAWITVYTDMTAELLVRR